MSEWERVKIEELCTIEKGITGLAKAIPGKYPLVATSSERKTSTDYQFDDSAVCVPLVSSTGHGKKSLNYVHYQEGKFALGSILAAIIPKDSKVLNVRYLHAYLQKNKDRVIVPLMKGAANVSLSVKAISGIEIPLPTIKEQEIALAKIDGISSEYEDFLKEADVQTNLFGQLRQAVLQEAIEGKLTIDWRKLNPKLISGENHASKLLEKIKAEKEKLIKEKKVKKQKLLAPITDDEKPFVAPDGWGWVRLGEICTIQTGKRDANEGCENGIYNFYTCAQTPIKSNIYSFEGESILLPGNGANVGFSIYLNEKFEAYQRTYVLNDFHHCYIKFIFTLLQTSWKKRLGIQYGSAINYIRIDNVTDFIVPLPPLQEQKAIVFQAGKFMAMLDDLEKQVTERKERSQRLMKSVLKEAFEG